MMQYIQSMPSVYKAVFGPQNRIKLQSYTFDQPAEPGGRTTIHLEDTPIIDIINICSYRFEI